MTEQARIQAFHAGRNVRLDTLVRLRWLAVIGQTTAVLVVYLGLDFELPIWACLAVIALAAWLNVALRLRFRMTRRVEPERAAWLLAFDIAELAILLFLTGGLENPFASPPVRNRRIANSAMSKASSQAARSGSTRRVMRKRSRKATLSQAASAITARQAQIGSS